MAKSLFMKMKLFCFSSTKKMGVVFPLLRKHFFFKSISSNICSGPKKVKVTFTT